MNEARILSLALKDPAFQECKVFFDVFEVVIFMMVDVLNEVEDVKVGLALLNVAIEGELN